MQGNSVRPIGFWIWLCLASAACMATWQPAAMAQTGGGGAQEFYGQALDLYQIGDTKAAIRKLRRLIARYPRSPLVGRARSSIEVLQSQLPGAKRSARPSRQSGLAHAPARAADEEDSLSYTAAPLRPARRSANARRAAGAGDRAPAGPLQDHAVQRPGRAGPQHRAEPPSPAPAIDVPVVATPVIAKIAPAPARRLRRRPAAATRKARPQRPPANERFRRATGDRVFFAETSVKLGATARRALSAQAAWLKQRSDLLVRVEGYADDPGTGASNSAIALQRAQTVRDRLVEEGVAPGRISIAGFGRKRRIALCKAPHCAAQNRRAITVVSAGTRTGAASQVRQFSR